MSNEAEKVRLCLVCAGELHDRDVATHRELAACVRSLAWRLETHSHEQIAGEDYTDILTYPKGEAPK